ncbi:MAG: hypothetical protein AAB413_05570 [Patescibacteria group bacterium]
MRMRWNIVAVFVIVLFVAAVGFMYIGVIPSSTPRSLRLEESRDLEETGDLSTRPSNGLGRDDTLTETTCSDSGGTWNPCGSACRTDPDAICIELCVEYCECKTDLECPSGYTCGDFVDEVGVCLSDAG